jgi:hypothetical protein
VSILDPSQESRAILAAQYPMRVEISSKAASQKVTVSSMVQ